MNSAEEKIMAYDILIEKVLAYATGKMSEEKPNIEQVRKAVHLLERINALKFQCTR